MVLQVLLYGVVAEEREAGRGRLPAAELGAQRVQELLDGGGTIEADHLIGVIEHVHGYRVRQTVMVRVLQ